MRQSESQNRAAPTFVSQPGSGVDAHYDHGRPRLELSGHRAGRRHPALVVGWVAAGKTQIAGRRQLISQRRN
jgi:hypothetical protein